MSANNSESIDPAAPDTELRRTSHIPPAQVPDTVPPVVPARPPLPEPDPSPTVTPEPTVTSDSPRRPARWLWPTLAGVVGLVIGVVIGSTVTGAVTTAQRDAAEKTAIQAAEDAKSSLFADAARSCLLTGVVKIEDDGRTLVVDGEGEDPGSGAIDFDGLDCIIDAVGTPASVRELMYATRSIDGRQTGEWDDVSASWVYHPDDGLDIIFVIED